MATAEEGVGKGTHVVVEDVGAWWWCWSFWWLRCWSRSNRGLARSRLVPYGSHVAPALQMHTTDVSRGGARLHGVDAVVRENGTREVVDSLGKASLGVGHHGH